LFAEYYCLLHWNLSKPMFETNADVASSSFDSLITILTSMSKRMGCGWRGGPKNIVCRLENTKAKAASLPRRKNALLDNGEEQGAKGKNGKGEKNEGFFASLRMTA
jgi:hypothetical protein